jgi:hypothetical protein
MPRPDLKSLPITEWFTPRSVEEQLKPALESLGIGIGKYRHRMNFWTTWFAYSGNVVRPFYEEENKGPMSLDQRAAATVKLIYELEPDQTFILPYDADILPSINRWRLIKKGGTLKVRYNPSTGKDLKESVIEKVRTENLVDVVTGIDYEGVRYTSRIFKIFTLVDCIKGDIMDKELPADAIKVSVYLPSTSQKLWAEGAMAYVEGVPSLSRNKTYSFPIKHIPVRPKGRLSPELEQEIAKTSYDILSTSESELPDFYDLKYGRGGILDERERKGDELAQSAHIIVAYHRIQKTIQKQHPELEVINPFLRPNRTTESFFWKLLHQTIWEEPNPERGNYHRHPLGDRKTDIEIMLHKFMGYQNKLINI